MPTTTMTMSSPLGPLRLHARGEELIGVYLPDHDPPPPVQLEDAPERETPVLVRTAAQLREYFAGERTLFDLPLAPDGTGFQRLVWDALAQIPYGVTRSYGELARAIGRPAASRAVGTANARNPISIIVPCHRVIGASGALTGYAGGMEAKQWLLAHEQRYLGARPQRSLSLSR